MDDLLKQKLRAYCELKYPTRYGKGIRRVQERDNFVEVWSTGGEVTYFSKTFMDEFTENV